MTVAVLVITGGPIRARATLNMFPAADSGAEGAAPAAHVKGAPREQAQTAVRPALNQDAIGDQQLSASRMLRQPVAALARQICRPPVRYIAGESMGGPGTFDEIVGLTRHRFAGNWLHDRQPSGGRLFLLDIARRCGQSGA